MINLIYPFPGLSPEVFITPEYYLLVGSTFSCIFEDNRQVRSIRACSPPRLPVLHHQHVTKAYAGAAITELRLHGVAVMLLWRCAQIMSSTCSTAAAHHVFLARWYKKYLFLCWFVCPSFLAMCSSYIGNGGDVTHHTTYCREKTTYRLT